MSTMHLKLQGMYSGNYRLDSGVLYTGGLWERKVTEGSVKIHNTEVG